MQKGFFTALENSVGGNNLITGEHLSQRTNGYWDPSPIQALAVVTPENIDQLQASVKCCHHYRQPMVVQGGLTGVVKGQLAGADEIAISLEKMSAIREFDPVGKTLVVEAGCTLQQVQEFARGHDLLFPVDIGARGSCTIGGNIATNAGGMEVIRYGMMKNHVLGLEAVLSDGTLLSSMNRMQKNNTGFDLKQLFIGSEGTLGIVSSAVLQLKPLPKSCETAFIACRDFEEVAALLDSSQRFLGDNLTRFELMDNNYYALLTGSGNNTPPVARHFEWYVLVEAMGYEPDKDRLQFQTWLELLMAGEDIGDGALAQNNKQRENMWMIREVFDVAIAEKPYFTYDVSLPLQKMPAYIRQVKDSISSLWPRALFFTIGHMADGNLHFFLSPCAGTDENALKALADRMIYEPLASIGGSVSAEHGIGLDKKAWLKFSRNETEIQLMKKIKKLLDPENLLNRGRLFDLDLSDS